MARRYSHRPLFPNPVVSFFLFWLGYILNGSTLPPSVTFCTARYDCLTRFAPPPIVPSGGAHTFRESAPPSTAAPRRFSPAALWSRWLRRSRSMATGNFGERLKRERELREVSPNEVVVATRISLRFLQALENEDWDKLPGGIFNRGFVRSIAQYLGLDEEDLLAEYDLAHGEQSPEAQLAAESRIPAPPRWIPVALALGAVAIIAALVAVGVYTWRHYSAYHHGKQSPAVTTQS